MVRLRRKEGGREEEPTNAAEEAPAQGMRIEHTCCCLGVLVGISLIAGMYATRVQGTKSNIFCILAQQGIMAMFGRS